VRQFRFGSAFLAIIISAAAAQMFGGGVAVAAPLSNARGLPKPVAVPLHSSARVGNQADPPITTACASFGTTSGSTFTLFANCPTTAQLTVPTSITTVNGAGHTITATDPAAGFFSGAVLTNDPLNHSMAIENLIISGTFTPMPCVRGTLFGIHFNDASGSVSNVTVDGITEDTGCTNLIGIGIRADGVTAQRTVTITNTRVTNYQRNGMDARGSMTMNISGSFVHPKNLSGVIAQNGVVYSATAAGQPGGSVSGSTIYGIGDEIQEPTPALAVQPAIIMLGAKNVTITNNTLTSDPSHLSGPDAGVIVEDTNENGTGTLSTGIVVSFNHITRSHPNSPQDLNGFGVWVVSGSQATLICNTFSNWKTNVVGAVQIDCTPLPPGTECHAYSAPPLTAQGGTPPYSFSASGQLPPGLSISSAGAITGTPTAAGTFNFTVHLVDSSSPPLTATQAGAITIAPDCATPTPAPTGGVSGVTAPTTGAAAPSSLLVTALLAGGAAFLVLGLRRRRS
jgi:hypothetical protein